MRSTRTPFRRIAVLLWAFVAVVAPLDGARPARAAGPPVWRYEVSVDAALTRMDVRLAFESFVPRRLMLAGGGALDALDLAPARGGLVRDPSSPTHLQVVRLDEGGGVSFGVDLKSMCRVGDGSRRVGRDLLTRSGDFLLRPSVVTETLRATVSVRLPPGLRVLAPWTPAASVPAGASAAFELDSATWDFQGHVAFGRFEVREVPVPGTTVRIAVLDGEHRATLAGIEGWITTAARAVSLPFGRFPASRLPVIVIPSPGRGDAVPFGTTFYGGGPHTILYLSNTARDEDLPGEWVAVHEMLHTTMPSVSRDDAWLSEGFVTYVQEITRTRAGFQTALQGWQQIEEGFDRGRSVGGKASLAEESRDMGRTHGYWRVYWAGAAIALELDVTLRRESGGRRSLDDVLRAYDRRRQASPKEMSTAEAVRIADAVAGRPVLAGIVARHLPSPSFPDVHASQAWLGITVRGGRVSFVQAPGAAERDRMLAPPAAAPKPIGVEAPVRAEDPAPR